MLPWVFRTGDATFVPSSRGRRFLLSLGLAPEHVHVTPYAVDNGFFASRADLADSIETRQAWDVPKEAFIALFVGKLVEWKRPGDLMRAAAIVPDTWVVYAGDGELRGHLTELAESLGI